MREDHDGCFRCEAFQILLQATELGGAELTQTTRLSVIHDIHESDEVNALMVEAVPAVSFDVRATVAVEI